MATNSRLGGVNTRQNTCVVGKGESELRTHSGDLVAKGKCWVLIETVQYQS